jgi:probable F420-dependent oxidoreductase
MGIMRTTRLCHGVAKPIVLGVPSIGLYTIAMQYSDGEELAHAAVLAEELGYDSVWAGEHVVLPSPRRAPSPLEPTDAILDPLAALAFLAGHTRRMRLATGIVILPQRNPLVLAKELASLDWLSGGRLVFGLGVGYVGPEMTAVGVPMARRGTRADEYLAAMRALWEEEQPSFEGEFVSFADVDAHPRPLQRPLPVVVAGHSPAGHRRAARLADGWCGFMLNVEETAEHVRRLRRALAEAGRSDDRFEITVVPRGRIDPDVVAAYGELGVDRLALLPRGEDVSEFIREHSPERLGALPLAA